MKRPESVEETLLGIEKSAYMEEQDRLISCSRMIMAKAGVKFRHWSVFNKDNRVHYLGRNIQIDYIKQSKTISLYPDAARELDLGATAVAIGYSEQWYHSTLTGAYFTNPSVTSWLIWPLVNGESNDQPYNVEAADISFDVYKKSELGTVLGFSRLDRFASVVDAIEESYGDLTLPRHS